MRIETVEDILEYHDATFLEAAYRAVLGRSPDPDGMRYYLRRIRSGYPRIHILMQLRASDEGQRNSTLRGLDVAIGRYKRSHWPLIGWLFSPETNTLDYSLRALENQLHKLLDNFKKVPSETIITNHPEVNDLPPMQKLFTKD